MKLGEVIRCFRIANDYSIKEMAKICGKSAGFFSDIESTNKNPSLQTLKEFADCFNVSTSTIVEIQEQSEKENWNFQKTLLEILKRYVGE